MTTPTPHEVDLPAAGSWEPYLTVAFLPGCRGCGAVHPRAMKPPRDLDECPSCGKPVGQTRTKEVPAALGGLQGWLANLFLAIGRGLRRLAKEV